MFCDQRQQHAFLNIRVVSYFMINWADIIFMLNFLKPCVKRFWNGIFCKLMAWYNPSQSYSLCVFEHVHACVHCYVYVGSLSPWLIGLLFIVQSVFTTDIGFLKEAPRVNIHGFCIYHRNRLILVILLLFTCYTDYFLIKFIGLLWQFRY